MTAAPTNDDDLGLNLVFTSPSLIASSTTTTGTGGGGIIINNKKPKRKTKYDKRRERGKLAKAAKDEEKRKKREHQQREGGGGLYNNTPAQLQEGRHDTKLGDGDDIDDGGERKVSSLVSIAAALNGSVSDNNKKKKAIAYTTPPVAESKVAAEKQLGGGDENDVKTGTQVVAKVGMKEDDLRVPRPKIESASSAVVPRESLPIEPTPPTASQPVEDTSSSSRKHRVRVLYITLSFIFTNMHILCTLLLFSMTCIYIHMQTYHHET